MFLTLWGWPTPITYSVTQSPSQSVSSLRTIDTVLFPTQTKGIKPVPYPPVFNQCFFVGSKITKQQLLKSVEKWSSGPLGNRVESIFKPFFTLGSCATPRKIQEHPDVGVWEQHAQYLHLEMEKGAAGELQTSEPGLRAQVSSRKKLWGYWGFLKCKFFKTIYFPFWQNI